MNSPQADRYSLAWLLGASAWVIAPLALEMPWWLGAAVALLLAWTYLHAMHGWPLPGRGLRTVLMLLLVVLIYRHFHTLFGRDAGVALLVALCGLKLLESRGQRDYVVAILVLCVLMSGALLFSHGMGMAVYTVGSVVLVLSALSSLHHRARAPARVRLAAGLVLKAAPIMVLMFVLFPRVQGGLWPVGAGGSAVTGMSDTMSPGSFGQVNESDSIAFRVEFEGPVPPPAQRYWRTLVFNRFDGREWSRGLNVPDPDWQGLGEATGYTVIAEASGRTWMSVLDRPASVPPGASAMPGFVLEHSRPIDARVRYRAVSYLDHRTEALDDGARAIALQLPEISPRVAALAGQWRGAAREPRDAVLMALRHFHDNEFAYSLRPPPLHGDAVDEFLFETRTGYCEHYSSAFVVLARAMGIPARVVVGYQGGEMHPDDHYLIVREADAHAWAEVWLPPQGWVRVDPTAAIAPERIEYGSEAIRRLAERGLAPGRVDGAALARAMELPWLTRAARTARLWWDGTEMAWDRWVAGYSPERQQELLARLGLGGFSWNTVILMLAALVALSLTTLALAARSRGPAPDPVQKTYLRYCAKLARVGLARFPHEGPLAFAERCRDARPDLWPQIDDITRRYLGLRYGEEGHEPQAFQAIVRNFRPGLNK